MKYKISIVVPVYNSEKYLEKCIESIMNQTLKDIELILINDGSTDNSRKICDYYKYIDKRIKVLHIKNNGVSNARNVGISYANGKYIMFADSDDYVHPKWCETLYKVAESKKDDFIVCGYKIINQRITPFELKKVLADTKDKNLILHKSDFYLLYRNGLLNSPCNKIFKTDILQKNKIRYKKDLSLGEDMIFNLDYLKYCNGNINIINECLYYYVQSKEESLDYKYYSNLLEIYSLLFYTLRENMKIFNADFKKYEKYFWTDYFYLLEKTLRNTLHKDNNISIIEKVKYNNSIVKSEDFITSITYLNDKDVNKFYLKALKTKNYIVIYTVCEILSYLSKIKKYVTRGKMKGK